MDRSDWLTEKRRLNETQEDTIYAPIYDYHCGAITPTHHQFLSRFLSLCPPQGRILPPPCAPQGRILDARCGTGKYWPLMLASGCLVFGIDQSQVILARAHEKFPEVPCEKLGLQELRVQAAFDGAVCIDALEVVPPEDWPLVLGNLYLALKPSGSLYLTVEIAAAQDIEKALWKVGRQACRLSMANGRRKAGIMLTGRRTVFTITTPR